MAFSLRAVFSADTKGIKQGSKEAQAAIKEFEGTTENAIDSVAGLFGTSMKQIDSALNSVQGGFMALNRGINGSATATGVFAKALNVLKVALAATGIGALVVALGSLVAYFTKSQRGADQLAKAMAVVKQVFATVVDVAIKLGEELVNEILHPIEAFKKLFDKNSWKDMFKGVGDAVGDVGEKVSKRVKLTEKQQALERKMMAFEIERAKLEQQLAQQKEIAADKENRSLQERYAANQKALALQSEISRKETEIAQEKLALIQEENSLSESMNKDLWAEVDAEKELLAIETKRASATKELLGSGAEIANQLKKQREEEEKIANLKARKKVELTVQKVDDTKIQSMMQGFTIPVKLGIKEDEWKKLQERVKPKIEAFTFDIESAVEGMISGVAQAMGEMLANLITGDAKIEDLIGGIAQMLGQVLQQIGSALIAYGVAMDTFKKAFSNPYAAIAAGAALMAAGAMVSSLAGRLSGGGRHGMGHSYNTAIGAGSTLAIAQSTKLPEQGTVNVNVTGTLVGQGTVLKAVIDNENKRKGLSS